MQIPFVTKWVESRLEKQMWEEVDDHESSVREKAQREEEAADELGRIENEKWEQENQAHKAEFGHGLYVNADGKCDVCAEAVEEADWAKEYQEHLDQFGHEFYGNTSCTICADEEDENRREQEFIFAQ